MRVVDASGKSGKNSPGKRAAAQLRQRGFKVDSKVATGARTVANQIRYGSAGERQAGAIAPLLPGGQMTIDKSITDGTVVVVIGSGGFRLAPPSIADVGGTSAQQAACTD